MSRLPTNGRSAWMPGMAYLGTAVGASALLGLSMGARAWSVYAGLAAAVLLLLGWLERLWSRSAAPPKPRSRGKLRVVRGGKGLPYDLEADNSTDNQRYLM